MNLPKGFHNRPVTETNLRLLKKHRDNDEELCTDSRVWKDLLKDNELPAIMDSVLAWIAPPP